MCVCEREIERDQAKGRRREWSERRHSIERNCLLFSCPKSVSSFSDKRHAPVNTSSESFLHQQLSNVPCLQYRGSP